MRNYSGSCHCGTMTFSFETGKPLAPRACQCSFCRKHAARTVTDPDGQAVVEVPRDGGYRFASRAADYLVCGRCGVYIGAVARIDGTLYATLNLNAFDQPHPELMGTPVSYDDDTPETKAQRRRERWTPVITRIGRSPVQSS